MRGFFAHRWNGETPIGRLFWVDLIFVGTLINLAVAFVSLVLLGLKLPLWLALAAFLAPVPYNVFLVFAVWRTTGGMPADTAGAYRAGALVWLALACIL